MYRRGVALGVLASCTRRSLVPTRTLPPAVVAAASRVCLAHPSVSFSSAAINMPLSDVPDVDMDPSGTFKYILIRVKDKSSKEEKYIVRAYDRCVFHADILDEAREAIPQEFSLKCVGGGRVKHTPGKEVFVYGYSQGYGRADHTIAVDILKKQYPDYHIHYSNDGY